MATSIVNSENKNSYNLVLHSENKDPKISTSALKKAQAIWSYVGKILVLIRHSGNAASRLKGVSPEFIKNVKWITPRIRMCSPVGLLLNFENFVKTPQALAKEINEGTRVTIGLKSISLTLLAAEVLDSIVTVTNASREILAKSALPLFASVGLPLGYAMSGLGCIPKMYHLSISILFLSSLKEKEVQLKEKGLTEAESQQLLQKAPQDLVDELKNFYNLVKSKAANVLELNQSYERIKNLAIEKGILNTVDLSTNVLILSALGMLSAGITSAVPFSILAASFLIRISTQFYQDFLSISKNQVAPK